MEINKMPNKLLKRKLKNLLSVAEKVETRINQLREELKELEQSYELWAQYLFLFVVFNRINEVLIEANKEPFDRKNIKGCRDALAHPEVTSLPFARPIDVDEKREYLSIAKEEGRKRNRNGGKIIYPPFEHWLMEFDVSDPENRKLVASYLTETLDGLKQHIKGLKIEL